MLVLCVFTPTSFCLRNVFPYFALLLFTMSTPPQSLLNWNFSSTSHRSFIFSSSLSTSDRYVKTLNIENSYLIFIKFCDAVLFEGHQTEKIKTR